MPDAVAESATTGHGDLTPAELGRMYEVMRTIADGDDRFREEVRSARLAAAYYPVHGLEGVCGALALAVDGRDRLVSTYRNLGDAIAKGADLTAIVAECAGRATGTSKGKGGPMHIQDLDVGLMMTTGVVGSGLPIAAGLALAAQLDGDGRATVVTFGDGATSIGAYHEAMNMTALWSLPLVLICQNNGWAEHTPIAEYAPVTDLAARAASYGIESVAVDGFDPQATWRVLHDAVERARANAGPTFVECRTYRMTGHVGTGDYSYMPQEELDAALNRDPVPAFRSWLLARGVVDAETLDTIDARAAAAIDDAFTSAYAAPPPDASEQYRDVFADERLVPGR
ncbi:MAG: thiamine pyrophosphate-dependent dehydrogenase E1 component subunit alpha [Acidimicrobiales bacterium]